MDLQERSQVLEGALAAAGVAKYAYEISDAQMRELNTEQANFNLFRTVFSSQASVSVFVDGKKGSAFGNDLGDEGIAGLVADALGAADSAVADDANDIAPCQGSDTFRIGPLEPDMDGLYRRMEEAIATVEREYPKALLMQMIGSHTKSHAIYANSNGTRFETFEGAYGVMLEFAGNDGESTTGLTGSSVRMDDLDTPILDHGILRKQLADAEASLCVVPVGEKFEGTVVFDPNAAGDFVSMLVGNFMSSGVVVDGTSLWLDRVGEQVAHESVTLRLQSADDRLVAQNPYTGDGYRAENVTLIENGVLKSHVLNLYAANKTGRPVTKNSGGCLILEPGETPVEELVRGVDRGLLVGWFSGGRPGANGEFSGVAKSSFYIEDGQVKGAVAETMISGNLADVFAHVAGVSRELFSDGTAAFPYVAVTGVTVSGGQEG